MFSSSGKDTKRFLGKKCGKKLNRKGANQLTSNEGHILCQNHCKSNF